MEKLKEALEVDILNSFTFLYKHLYLSGMCLIVDLQMNINIKKNNLKYVLKKEVTTCLKFVNYFKFNSQYTYWGGELLDCCMVSILLSV